MTKSYIYLAGGLFNGETNMFNAYLAQYLEKKKGYTCFLPQRDGFEVAKFVAFLNTVRGIPGMEPELAQEIAHFVPYYLDLGFFMSRSVAVVGNIDDPTDDGTMIELAYARFVNLPIVGIRTDVRSPLGDVAQSISINPFPVMQCDVFIRGDVPTGDYDQTLNTMDKLIDNIDVALKDLMPKKQNKMLESDNSVIKAIIKGADILFKDIKDIHEVDSMKEMATRYIKNHAFFKQNGPRILDTRPN